MVEGFIPTILGEVGSVGKSTIGVVKKESIDFVPGNRQRVAFDFFKKGFLNPKVRDKLKMKDRKEFSIEEVFFYPCTLHEAFSTPSKIDFIVVTNPSVFDRDDFETGKWFSKQKETTMLKVVSHFRKNIKDLKKSKDKKIEDLEDKVEFYKDQLEDEEEKGEQMG